MTRFLILALGALLLAACGAPEATPTPTAKPPSNALVGRWQVIGLAPGPAFDVLAFGEDGTVIAFITDLTPTARLRRGTYRVDPATQTVTFVATPYDIPTDGWADTVTPYAFSEDGTRLTLDGFGGLRTLVLTRIP